MAISDHELTEAWKTVLALSRLEPEQTVTILTGPNTHPQTLSTAIVAAQAAGAIVNRLDMLPVNGARAHSRDPLAYVGSTPLTGNAAAMAMCKASDLVLDLMLLLFSPEQAEILESGTKILLAVEPPEILARLVPTEEDKARVQAAGRLIAASTEMRVTSAAGTDLICALGQYPAVLEYGFVDEPGRWDHWPSGFALTWPDEGACNGTIIVDRGDILLPMKSYVAEPIVMTVKDGYVTRMEGGVDAELLWDYMEAFNDPEGFAMSHIGWGLQDRARWSTLGLYDREQTIGMDARAFAGNFLFSLGPNTEVGGERNTACHIDIPLRRCTVALDGREVVREGRLIDLEAAQ
ncbi:2,5-dihydroxypyridine 5,6-dioxygenase [Sphingomonas oleivorans]|uniref:2,5-dihydroxypyridine 5,6-dioxygenase n=1 Tax=Sphingomonas oleivorans TaxID=1735121 RepID=A0A2T5FU27_9SPHN|nr:2,5-dihydroxypyridine 5,6-dioxygenase [Sphingomonas oleivorans]PTQ07771.1 2,5-dihydroxypyridine 5,6-dioxygenase [Sphingomonas oleivorans]